MTTYVNVHGIKNRLATPARPDDFVNVPITDINTIDPRIISWSTTDSFSLSYATPYYDKSVDRDYYIYFTTPNDGITHHYDLGGYFNIPTGYLSKTILSFNGGLFGVYSYPYNNADFIQVALYAEPAYWISTDLPVNLTTYWAAYNTPIPPNTNCRMILQLTYSWTADEWSHIYNGDTDSMPLDTGCTIICNDFGGVTKYNVVQMIIEQN